MNLYGEINKKQFHLRYFGKQIDVKINQLQEQYMLLLIAPFPEGLAQKVVFVALFRHQQFGFVFTTKIVLNMINFYKCS